MVGALLSDYSSVNIILSPCGDIYCVPFKVTQWRSVFWISAGVHIAGSGLYLMFGSDQVQAWARPEITTAREDEEKAEDVNRNTQTSYL